MPKRDLVQKVETCKIRSFNEKNSVLIGFIFWGRNTSQAKQRYPLGEIFLRFDKRARIEEGPCMIQCHFSQNCFFIPYRAPAFPFFVYVNMDCFQPEDVIDGIEHSYESLEMVAFHENVAQEEIVEEV